MEMRFLERNYAVQDGGLVLKAFGTQGRRFSLASGFFAFFSSLENGLRDGRVTPAAANIPLHPFGDLVVGRRGVLKQERLGRHQLTRRAVTALRSYISDKRGLEWV